MKITNSEVIKSGERELIDTITGELDWSAVETVFKKRHNLDIQDDVKYQQGDIVVFNNKIAYQLDFEVKLTLSILVDREGNALSLKTKGDISGNQDMKIDNIKSEKEIENIQTNSNNDIVESEEFEEELPLIDPALPPKKNISEMASKLANMISEINEE